MFNKSILVALILCACYLSATQADGLPVAKVVSKTLDATDTVGHVVDTVQNVGGGGGGLPGLSSLPVQLPVGTGGSPGLLGK